MDNTKGEIPEGNITPRSGEIFSSKGESAYESVRDSALGDQAEKVEPYADNSQSRYVQPEEVKEESQDSPPPFTENRGKKFLIIGIFAMLLFFILGLFFVFVLKNKGSKQKQTEKVKIVYWGLWDDETIMNPIIDDYIKNNPNIEIKFEKQTQKLYRERLQAAIDRSEGPDIFRFHNTWVPMFTSQLDRMPDNIYSVEEFINTFYPVMKNDLVIGNGIYGIPLYIDGLVLLYNEDILKSANIKVPKNWVEMKDAAIKMTVKKDNKVITAGVALGMASNISHFSDILGLMFLQNGTNIRNSFFSCADTTINTCGKDTLTFYRQFAETPNNVWDESLDNSIMAFEEGKVAMIFVPSWEILNIKAVSPKLNFKVASVPQLPCENESCPKLAWGSYWVEGVNAKSKSKVEAWKFLKYLSQSDIMQKRYELQVKTRIHFGEAYSRVELGKTLLDNPYLASVIEQAPYMVSFYSASSTNDGDAGLNSSLIKYLEDVVNSMSSGTSAESAVNSLESGFKQVYQRYKLSP